MKKQNRFTPAEYLKLSYLLENEFPKQSREQNRADGLEWEAMKNSPLQQLHKWMEKYSYRIKDAGFTQIEGVLAYISWAIIAVMFLAGLSVGSAFLEYGGDKLVNIVSFFIFLILLPFLFTVVSFALMLKNYFFASRHDNVASLVKIALNVIKALPFGLKTDLAKIQDHDEVIKSVSVKYLQYGSIALSLGALSALLITITAQDIAFGWNTTLDVTPAFLHHLVEAIAFPWREMLPGAVPSLELIEISHHYRLGNRIDPELVSQAKVLGSWWKFLALALLIWGVLPRLLLVVMARSDQIRTLKRMLLSHHNTAMLLKNMNEVHITTHAGDSDEVYFDQNSSVRNLQKQKSVTKTDNIIGWNLDKNSLTVIMEKKNIIAAHLFSAGGDNTIEDDDAIISSTAGSVIVIVKSWEPPMREFLDFISDLSDHTSESISIYPVGTVQKNHMAEAVDLKIWKEKIETLHRSSIGMHHEQF